MNGTPPMSLLLAMLARSNKFTERANPATRFIHEVVNEVAGFTSADCRQHAMALHAGITTATRSVLRRYQLMDHAPPFSHQHRALKQSCHVSDMKSAVR